LILLIFQNLAVFVLFFEDTLKEQAFRDSIFYWRRINKAAKRVVLVDEKYGNRLKKVTNIVSLYLSLFIRFNDIFSLVTNISATLSADILSVLYCEKRTFVKEFYYFNH